MARAPVTSDVFNAIADPKRRQIIDLLAGSGEQAVGDLVRTLRIAQPRVSKHLRVLRTVRLVSVSRCGRSRVYRLNADRLKPVHEWVKTYERFWSHQFDRIKARAEQKAQERKSQPNNPTLED